MEPKWPLDDDEIKRAALDAPELDDEQILYIGRGLYRFGDYKVSRAFSKRYARPLYATVLRLQAEVTNIRALHAASEKIIDDLGDDADALIVELGGDPGAGRLGWHVRQLHEEVLQLREMKERHLKEIVRLSQTMPFVDEVKELKETRAKLTAENGTLRARIAEYERDRREK